MTAKTGELKKKYTGKKLFSLMLKCEPWQYYTVHSREQRNYTWLWKGNVMSNVDGRLSVFIVVLNISAVNSKNLIY